jgi:copper chaperone CopZ
VISSRIIGGLVLAAAVAASVSSCRMRDMRTVRIALPDLRGGGGPAVVEAVLRGVDGVDPGSIRVEPGAVVVTYDSMKTARKNIEQAIAGAGFTANDIPADPGARAKLPADSR